MNATVRRVDGVEHRGALDVLQHLALPCDKPADTRRGFWWVAEVRGEPAAFAGMYPSAQWGDAFYLCRAGVLPEFRGQGLQKRLIRARAEFARRAGARWLITDTTANPPSVNSLVCCGFRLYEPARPWANNRALYWRKAL